MNETPSHSRPSVLRIGTRGSKLALVQTHMVRDALQAHHPDLDIQIIEINTSGDWRPEQGETRLSAIEGGKGLFAREIEQALLENVIDCGVHSLKDMPSFLPEGLVIDIVLPREDPRDVFLSDKAQTLQDLPPGSVVGTSSLRRQAFVLHHRPDLKVAPLRGNVPTRIQKLHDGQVDAAILAAAGLKRLNLENEATDILSEDDMLPAAAQGIVGIETKVNDKQSRDLLASLHCAVTGRLALAERAVLQILDGSCDTPIGVYAVYGDDATMTIRAAVAAADGSAFYEDTISGQVETDAQALALGQTLGNQLKPTIPAELLEGY